MLIDRRGNNMEALKVGKRGAIVVPANLRKRYGIEEGTVVTLRRAKTER
jgi:AbrB family looped-hinge helix DNA binding protein